MLQKRAPYCRASLGAFEVGRFRSGHANLFAFVDERRDLHYQSGFQLRRFGHV